MTENPRDVIANAVKSWQGLPHGMRYGLYDYSNYPGVTPPHVVRDPSGAVIFRSDLAEEAQAMYEQLAHAHCGQYVLAALARAGFEVVSLDQQR